MIEFLRFFYLSVYGKKFSSKFLLFSKKNFFLAFPGITKNIPLLAAELPSSIKEYKEKHISFSSKKNNLSTSSSNRLTTNYQLPKKEISLMISLFRSIDQIAKELLSAEWEMPIYGKNSATAVSRFLVKDIPISFRTKIKKKRNRKQKYSKKN